MFEALFLLALDADEGYIVESVLENLETALIGSVLAELALQERIEEIGYDLVDQGVLSRHKKCLRQAVTSGEEQASAPSLKYNIKRHLQ